MRSCTVTLPISPLVVRRKTRYVNWHAARWNIEVFRKVLTSGCAVEDAQLRHADRLKRYVVFKSIVAWRLFWLSKAHELSGDESCPTGPSKT